MASKRRKLLIGFTCLVLLPICAFFFWPEKDPMYKGHHMSEWLVLSYPHAEDKRSFNPSESEIWNAVMATAPKNIPLLIDWISADTDLPSPVGTIIYLMIRWHVPDSAVKTFLSGYERANARANGAAHAFKLFDSTQGATAIPQLKTIIATGKESARQRAFNALVYINKPALPALISIAATNNPSGSPIRFMAIGALSRHTDDPLVRKFLTKAATDTNAQVALIARESLNGRNSYGN